RRRCEGATFRIREGESKLVFRLSRELKEALGGKIVEKEWVVRGLDPSVQIELLDEARGSLHRHLSSLGDPVAGPEEDDLPHVELPQPLEGRHVPRLVTEAPSARGDRRRFREGTILEVDIRIA